MLKNPTTALVKTARFPALARVSSQLALTDKLLIKPEEPFLIPYRKGNKWVFYDRNEDILIERVSEYPRFSDEHRPAINWYVYEDQALREIHWKDEALVTSDITSVRDNPLDCDAYVILRLSEKTLSVVSTNDVLIRKIKINNREVIIVGCRRESTLYWTRKPLTVIIDIGDKITTKIGADFFHEIEMI